VSFWKVNDWLIPSGCISSGRKIERLICIILPNSAFGEVYLRKMKKGVKVWGLIVILMLFWSIFGGAVSAEIVNSPLRTEITTAEAKAMLQTDQNAVILDVRTPNEFSSGHIRGARCVPLSDLKAHISALDRSKGIVVYSDRDVESEEACEILAENGFRHIYNLHGGIEAWKRAGGEVSGSEEAKFEGAVKRGSHSKCDSCDKDSMRHASCDRTTAAPQKIKTTASTDVKTTTESEPSTSSWYTGNPKQFVFKTDSGGDLDHYYPCESPTDPQKIEFDIIVDVKGLDASDIEYAALTLDVLDVDTQGAPECGPEIDKVSFNGHPVGILSGANEQWSTFTTLVDPEWIKEGANRVRIDIDTTRSGCWCVLCNWGELTVQTNVYEYRGVQLKPGDLLFRNFKWNPIPFPQHVGIYAGNGKVVEALSEGGVQINDIKSFSNPPWMPMWKGAWRGATTVIGYKGLSPSDEKEKRQKVVAKAKSYNGTPFPSKKEPLSWINPDKTDKIYCGQLVYLAYKEVGYRIGGFGLPISPRWQHYETMGEIPGSGKLKRTSYFDDRHIKDYQTTKGLKSAAYSIDSSINEEKEPVYPKIYKIYPDTTISYPRAIDPTVCWASFVLSWQSNSSNLNLTLYKPDGSVAEDVNITHEKNTTLAYEYYTVPNPEPGNWTMNITAIDVPEEGENYSVIVYLMSNLTLFLSTEEYWCNLHEPIAIVANLTNDSIPFIGANVTAEVYKPDDSISNITLFDDGTHGDIQANNGIYSNTITPSIEGTYDIIAYASGIISDHYFTREAVTEMAVREQTVKFTDNYSDYGTDTDGDGLYNLLTVEAEANVTTTGNYTVDALLHDVNGTEVVSISNYTYLDARIQTLELDFNGISIYNHKANGTYNLSLELYDEYGTPIDYKYDAYTTSAYNYTDFQRPSVALTGYYSDYGTDTDGNGLYDYLTIDVGVNVANAGEYAINARIMTDTGEEIIWASNTSYLTADLSQTLQLNFDGRYIYGTMANGSYHLRDVYVYSIDDSTLSDHVYDAYTTSAYNYTDFEKSGFITGKVTDINGTPISNALVSVTGISVNYDYTDTSGNYSVMITQNGTYTVTVTPPPYANLVGDSTSVYVTVGETTFCNFTLKKGGTLKGRVTYENGTGIQDAWVEASDIAYTFWEHDITNSTGYYSINGLPNNTYIVTAYPPYGTNLVSNSTTASVTAGETTVVNLILYPPAVITGRITDENGIGIYNAYVEISGPTWESTYTNTTGFYTITGLEEGNYYIYAYPPSGTNLVSNSTDIFVKAGQTTTVNLILEEGGILTGRVTDINGTPIYNAYVEISGPTWESTYTNTTGFYTITGLEEGNYYIYAYPPSGINLVSNSTDVFVKAGQTTTVNLILEEGGILTGRVTDTNGTPIYNARVSASGPSYGSDYTNTSGYYEIVGLRTGTYRIGTHGQTGTNLVNVTCGEVTQKETATLNIVLHEGGMIKGRVTDEYGAAGVSNAYIYASGPIYMSANTNSAGYYTIEGLINGTYIVTAEGSYGSNLLSNPIGADVKEGETIELNFTLRTGGIITGRVTDENGLPIADVDVEAFSMQGYGSYEWAYTDYNGYYTITGLQTGEYTVIAYGYWYGLADNSTTAFVQLSEPTTVNFILHEGGTLTGEVTYENGTATPYVEVVASGKSYGWDETDLNGHYTITGLRDGEYKIIASEYSTNLADSTTAIVTSGETTTANLTLHEGGIVKGKVTDVNGTGIANAWIDIYISPPTGYYWYWYGYYNSNQTNSTGYYIIKGIPNGTYNITASPYGYCGDEKDLVDNSSIVHVIQSQTTTHNFILQNGGAIKGIVTTQDGIPIAGAFISAEGSSYGYTYTSTDGNYTITRLQAGTYVVSAYPPPDVGLAGNSTSADVSTGQTTPNVDIVLLSNKPPIASFTYTPENPAINQTITFNASNSTDPDGTITSYEWDFGDGTITNTAEEIITHFYSSAGDYITNLTVTDDDGATNSTTKTLTIYPPTAIFDTGSGTYPSISGNHTGTITPNQTIIVQKLYTYPCAGTGGHTKYAKIWNSSWGGTEAHWNGYNGDWHNITFSEPFILRENETYDYTIRTGSYPQIIHESPFNATGGVITCTSFEDANGKVYMDWILAIRLE